MEKNNQDNSKQVLAALSSWTLRGLIDAVNENNSSENNVKILKDDVVGILKENDAFYLLYFK